MGLGDYRLWDYGIGRDTWDVRIELNKKLGERRMKMLEKKIYNSWAFTQNESEKSKINYEIYQEIKDKAEVEWVGSGYAHTKYKVVSNPNNLSTLELALICDGGNLCFGYRKEGNLIVINTD